MPRAQAAGTAFGPGWRPVRIAAAPGRLELLGNHIDYNGGKVLAAAINRQTVVLAGVSDGAAVIDAIFADFSERDAIRIDPAQLHDWRNPTGSPRPADYLRGTIAALLARPEIGLRSPAQLAVAGDVPIGFGLSSSAALCVALTMTLAAAKPDAREIVLIAQEAEHRAGTPCGTMDQFASVTGGVILYDAARLKATAIHPDLGPYVFAVAESGVDRSLAESSYAMRVRESQDVLDRARHVLRRDLPNLAAMTSSDVDALRRHGDIPPHLLKRATHVVTEVARVEEGLTALEDADWVRFGELMTASGRSSALDYEISHPRVEALVTEARAVDGVLGARMMGGGEGGSALILLRRDALRPLESHLRANYYAVHGMANRSHLVYAFQFAGGAQVGEVNRAPSA